MDHFTNLYDANKQWQSRPSDEVFPTIPALVQFCSQVKLESREVIGELSTAEATAEDDGSMKLQAVGFEGKILHHSFNQLASLTGAPAGYLRSLPAPIAAGLINYGLKGKDGKMNLLVMHDGRSLIRSITSDSYARAWNADVVQVVERLAADTWTPPPKAKDGKTGLYASDKDMFVFLISKTHSIEINGKTYTRGVFIENSEVGDRALKFTAFYYNYICGNHIVWEVPWYRRIKLVHRGEVNRRFEVEAFGTLKSLADISGEKDRQLIQSAQTHLLGNTGPETIEALFNKRIASKTDIEAAYAEAVNHQEDHGSKPESVWGMAQGFGRASQKTPYTDKRVEMERAAAKLLTLLAK